jgi:hypothetical protein
MADATATPQNMEEALAETGAALAMLFAGMIVTKILTHFELLSSNARNTSKKYQCLTCNKVMIVAGDMKLKHHVAQVEGGGCSLCPNPNPAMKKAFKAELEARAQKKRSSLSADASCSSSSPKAPNTGIMTAFGKAGRKEADQAILNWLASSGLPPYAVEGFYFKDMLQKTRGAGPTYQPPNRHSLGRVNNMVGHVLQEGLDRIRELRSADLAPVQHVKVRGCVMRLCLAIYSLMCVCTNSTPSPSWTLPKRAPSAQMARATFAGTR